MTSLLLISIGPVQDFIASARRSRDLWFGSWMLSEVSKACALKISEIEGIDSLIFPAVTEQQQLKPSSSDSVANKILAQVSGDDVQSVAEKAVAAAKKRLDDMRRTAFRKLAKEHFNEEAAKRQIDDLLEIYWAYVPLTENYVQSRQRVEEILNFRKNTRLFQAVQWKDWIPKSSLDGLRESVIRKSVYNNKQLQRAFRLKKKEQLCGIGLLKRLGKPEKNNISTSFFSTPHVAALSFIERIENMAKKEDKRKELKKAIDTLKSYLSEDILKAEIQSTSSKNQKELSVWIDEKGRILNGGILFEERLHDQVKKDNLLSQARKKLQEIYRICEAEPSPYYAILVADGDRMGKAIDARNDIESHKRLSSSLNEFARSCRKIVEETHKGNLIYSGGDDVLAFLPVHEALSCAQELAKTFENKMGEFSFIEEGKTIRPTLSVGIAICHHLDHLGYSLNLARKAEKTAKKTRNSLAILLQKRGGSELLVSGEWQEFDQRIKTLIDFYKENKIPEGIGHHLKEFALRFETDPLSSPSEENLTFQKILEAESLKILERRQLQNNQNIDVEVTQSLANYITTFTKQNTSIKQLADELILAQFLATIARLVEISPE